MTDRLHAVSAHTTYMNTPETDKLPVVWHTVTMSDGTKRNVLAECPMSAIDAANAAFGR